MSFTSGATTVIHARKEHRCWWCGEAIPRGTTYIKWSCLREKPLSIKCHCECEVAWGKAIDVDDEYLYDVDPYEHVRGAPYLKDAINKGNE